jgi:hypothetical protein
MVLPLCFFVGSCITIVITIKLIENGPLLRLKIIRVYGRGISGTMEDFHFLSVTGYRLVNVYCYIQPCAM